MSTVDTTENENLPPEILCKILHFAIGSPDGINALPLPFTQVCARWRRAALGDSSLWTTISLRQTTAPLLDMILAYAGNRLFTVHVDGPDLNRFAMLWKLVDRIEELHYSDLLQKIVPFLSSLGPAPNLKVLDLQPMIHVGSGGESSFLIRNLPVIFSGCLPSLRDLTLSNTIAWPAGLFKGLVSFSCNTPDISLVHVWDVLRESPLIEFIGLDGDCDIPPGFDPPTLAFRSLEKCGLSGHGTTSLIRFMTIPASAHVLLIKPYHDGCSPFPKSEDLSAAPGLHVLDEVSVVSFSISDCTALLQTENDNGGVLQVNVDELHELSQDGVLAPFLQSFFECGHTCPGFKTTKELELDIDRGRILGTEEVTCFVLGVSGFIRNLPDVEGVVLRGVPSLELAHVIERLRGDSKVEMSCPNLKRLHIEPASLHSPRPLLVGLDQLLTERKRAGRPLQSITVEIECEMLIPAADHRAFLASWEDLVEGDVRLEYERPTVELPRCHREEGACEGAGAGDPDCCCVGWDGWPEQWPKTMGELRGQ